MSKQHHHILHHLSLIASLSQQLEVYWLLSSTKCLIRRHHTYLMGDCTYGRYGLRGKSPNCHLIPSATDGNDRKNLGFPHFCTVSLLVAVASWEKCPRTSTRMATTRELSREVDSKLPKRVENVLDFLSRAQPTTNKPKRIDSVILMTSSCNVLRDKVWSYSWQHKLSLFFVLLTSDF